MSALFLSRTRTVRDPRHRDCECPARWQSLPDRFRTIPERYDSGERGHPLLVIAHMDCARRDLRLVIRRQPAQPGRQGVSVFFLSVIACLFDVENACNFSKTTAKPTREDSGSFFNQTLQPRELPNSI